MGQPKTYYEQRRDRVVSGYSKVFSGIIDAISVLVLGEVLGALSSFDFDEKGNFSFSVSNLTRSRQVAIRVSGIFQQQKKPLGARLIDAVKRLLGFNRDYFQSFNEFEPEDLEKKVERLVMGRLGYDVGTGNIAPGSWLDDIFNGSQVSGSIGRDLANAIASKMSRAEFIRQFRLQFTQAGYPARHFKTFSFDFFQVVDRQIKLLYAEELGLTFARYAGTAEEDTRDFCLERLNLVYSFEEIKSWAKLDFRGKLKIGYDPFIHCGGFNCRHHLAFLDKEAVELLGIETDKYHSIVHK
jgi:hypothetical protein